MARPSDYTPELVEKARTYLDSYADQGDVIPSIEGFAVFLGLSRSTIYEWVSQEDKEEFSDIVENILAEQARTLANKGLLGIFNSSITKVMMTKHGYSDRQEITGKDGKDLIPEQKEAIDAALNQIGL